MFCAMCGAEGQSANAFCKRCGQWLPDMKARTGIAFGGETPQQNVFTGLFMNALSSLAALFSALALYVTYLGSSDAKWSIYVAAACCLCIAGWQAASFVVGLKLRRRLTAARRDVSFPEIEHKTNPALGPAHMDDFLSAGSVTEQTTGLLEPVQSPRTEQQ